MARYHLLKEPDGWRVAIEEGNKTTVLDEFFEDDLEAAVFAASLM